MAKLQVAASSDRSRAIYNEIQTKYGSKITTTQSYLRLERELTGSTNRLTFPVLNNDGILRGTEKRLALTDLFFATEMFVGIFKLLDTAAALPFGDPIHTFPNPTVFNAANEARQLQYIYNGQTNITIDNNIIVDGMDNLRFYRVAQAQQGLEVSIDTNTNPAYFRDSWDSASFGFFPLTPNIIFSGTAKNDVEIELPGSADLSGTSSTNYCVVMFRGILLQNASGFYKGMQSTAGRF